MRGTKEELEAEAEARGVPKVWHATYRVLDYLAGRPLRRQRGAACGAGELVLCIVVIPPLFIGEAALSPPNRLPTCPACSVLWDEALEAAVNAPAEAPSKP